MRRTGARRSPGFQNLTIEVGRQTNGSQAWHHLYGLPSYGVGFSVAHFQSGTQSGHPLEAYGFFSWPLVRFNERLDMTTDLGTGLSWHWVPSSGNNRNSNSSVLGSDLNARIDWGLYLRYISSSRTSVYSGFESTRQSNGGVVQPDKGINVLGPKVAMHTASGRDVPYHSDVPPPPFRPSLDLIVGGAGGLKNVLEESSPLLREDFGVFQALLRACSGASIDSAGWSAGPT